MQPWDMPTYGELALAYIALLLTVLVAAYLVRRK